MDKTKFGMSSRMTSFVNTVKERRLAEAGGKKADTRRKDLCFVDFRSREINGKVLPIVDLMVEFSSYYGEPTPAEVVAFVREAFDRKLMPLSDTLRANKARNYITLTAQMVPDTHSATDPRFKMVNRSAALAPDGEIWNVEKSESGARVLKRIDADAIINLLKRRVSLQRSTSFTTMRQAAADALMCAVGDRVSILHPTLNKPMRGIVESVGDKIKVVIEDGGKGISVPQEAVLAVLQRGAKSRQSSRQVTKDYYNKLLPGYGDKFDK